jgi:hypothetical protein
MISLRRQFFFSCCLVLFSHQSAAQAYGSGWYREIQATVGYENNISRTYLRDELDDRITSISVGGGHVRKVNLNAQLVLSGYATVNRHEAWDRLDHHAISLGLDYTVQPELGYATPWYQLSVSATDLTYRDNRPREGLLVESQISINKRLTTEMTGQFGVRYQNLMFNGKSSIEKSNDAAFNTNSYEWFAGANYAFAPGTYIFAEYGYRSGDITTVVSGGLRADLAYDAKTLDPTFYSDCQVSVVDDCFYAYRQDGVSQVGSLGLTLPLSGVNLDLSMSYLHAEGDNGRKYQDMLAQLGAVYFF